MRLIFSLILLFHFSVIYSQGFWQHQNESELSDQEKNSAQDQPIKFQLESLDFQGVFEHLLQAPLEKKSTVDQGLLLDLPLPDGTYESFRMLESPVMAPGLQAKYSSMKSYKGYSTTTDKNIRIDISKYGLHATIRSVQGTIYIDPYSDRNTQDYMVYYAKDDAITKEKSGFTCGVSNKQINFDPSQQTTFNYKSGPQGSSEVVSMREYRFALACTGEWGSINGGTVESVLAKLVSSTNRLNQILENEAAIRLIMVEESEMLIFLDPMTDPYQNPTVGHMLLTENTGAIANTIGLDKFDLGHIYTVGCSDTGGVAFLESICGATKGAGVSCDYKNNMNFLTVSIAAHEIGHQLGATHTYSNCNGPDSPGSAYEPGSGTTIMSYAGLCGTDNVANNNDDYYHLISLKQIFNFTRLSDGNSCANIIATSNTTPIPSHDYFNGFSIPIGTPFELQGRGEDAEDDDITYIWEQYNLGPVSDLGTPLGDAPSFRSVYPTTTAYRSFPTVTTVIANRTDINEVLPTASRNYTFNLVARDNSSLGGGVDFAEVRFKANQNAGPFLVKFPDATTNLVVGDPITITWDVANTDMSPINCSKVDITMTSDGGLNFDKVIARGVANTGSFDTYVPNVPGTLIRFKIKAANNIFYDMSNANSKITIPTESTFYLEALPYEASICLPDIEPITLTTAGFNGFDEKISFEVISGLPSGAMSSFSAQGINPGESTQLIIDLSNVSEGSQNTILIKATSTSGKEIIRPIEFTTIKTNFDDLVLQYPLTDEAITALPTFQWSAASAATKYKLEVSTTPAFESDQTLIWNDITDNSYTIDQVLDINKLYYWRVAGSNPCGQSAYTPTGAFHTVVLDCKVYEATNLPMNISSSGTREVLVNLNITDSGTAEDVNVKKIKGTHEQLSDLKFSLISPTNDVITLIDQKCINNGIYDAGFDDDAAAAQACPLTNGTSVKPEMPLATLKGKQINGTWVLKVEDKKPGDGGNIQNFQLEICSNITLANPYIVNNTLFEIPPSSSPRIKNESLLTADDNNTAEELVYTLVALPKYGTVKLNDADLGIGGQFTQKDIDDLKLRYSNDDASASSDEFAFVVEDGTGGWINLTYFKIAISTDFTSGTQDPELRAQIKVYPNPADEYIDIDLSQIKTQLKIGIYDLSGRKYDQLIEVQGDVVRVDTKHLPTGIYMLRIGDGERFITEKMVVMR